MEIKINEIDFRDYYWQDEEIRLRAFQPEDWETHYINRFDTLGRRFLENEVELPPTIAEAKNFIERNLDFSSINGRIMFTIENLKGENIGGINLNSIDERNGTFSIGMAINKDFRGKGYGTRAMKILLSYAFLELRLNKFNDSVLEGNEGSSKMLLNLGCVQEGIRRKNIYTNGQYLDCVLYGLTKDEFIKRKE